METIQLEQDIPLLCVTATSFPEGIAEAHQRLHAVIPFSEERRYFGISRPENGTIIYRAAAEELQEKEAERLNCDLHILKEGNYACITVYDYVSDVRVISNAFETLLAHPDLDPDGCCVEWYYTGRDVRCMVRLLEQRHPPMGFITFTGGVFFI